MTGTACHAINRVEDRGSGDGGMLSAQSPNNGVRWQRRQVSLGCWSSQGFGERQTAAVRRRLQDDVNIL
jgi:hypothetical protein